MSGMVGCSSSMMQRCAETEGRQVMADFMSGRAPSVMGADFVARQILPAQLDLLQLFLPMDYWLVGRREGKRFETIVVHGNADEHVIACMKQSLLNERTSPGLEQEQ